MRISLKYQRPSISPLMSEIGTWDELKICSRVDRCGFWKSRKWWVGKIWLDRVHWITTQVLLNSKSCTRKHVPEKKIRKSKKRVIPTDYRGFNWLVETRGIEPLSYIAPLMSLLKIWYYWVHQRFIMELMLLAWM